MNTVFISYSHLDEAWKDKLLPHLKTLQQAGVGLDIWQDRRIDAGAAWYPALKDAMADAVAAVLLISSDFLSSDFCIKQEVPFLIGRQEKEGMLLIPVLVRQCHWKSHRWLASRQMLPRDGRCVAIDFSGDRADVVFTDVAERVYNHFERLSGTPRADALPARLRDNRKTTAKTMADMAAQTREPPEWPPLSSYCMDLIHLPETGHALFGRDPELNLLDTVWTRHPDAGIRILAFTAHGGVGKSTLVNQWLSEMRADNFRGAGRVFGWSFYSQGVREQGTVSSDLFMDAALRFFGDTDPTAGSTWDKGERLARLAGAERALLVLDGLEPLQSVTAFDRGKLRDQAVEALLWNLARHSTGLCIITTREPLPDLVGRTGFQSHDLEQITPADGRAILRAMRIIGTDPELEALAGRFGPHALAVSLLGMYLHEQPGRGIGQAKALEQMSGASPVERVLAGFEQKLGHGPEHDTLRLMGFFDGPADPGCLEALRALPPVPGLTDRVAGMDRAGWDQVLSRLEKLRLIHTRQIAGERRFVDAHPLIREYFANKLRKQTPDAWRAGHKRLYKHLCAFTGDKKSNPTLEDLQPLYQAVAHGCQAGLHEEARAKVYRDRIQRGKEAYSTKKLGAFGSDLGAVACFFETPWTRVSPALSEGDQAWLLNEAATRLRALGRLTEALEPMRAGMEMGVKQENWKAAAIRASNLSELELTLGQVARAVEDAGQSVIYADHSGDAFQRMVNRTTHADALHQAGRRAEAEALFCEAEKLQAEDQPGYPLLYSLQGFQYCDLLLTEAEREAAKGQRALISGQGAGAKRQEWIGACREVAQRAGQTLKWEEGMRGAPLLDFALHHLTLGRAALFRAILEPSDPGLPASGLFHIEEAVSGLRRAGQQDELPRGLLTRAWRRALTGPRTGPDSAQADLDEAFEIAERGPMPLFMADIHLYRARLFFREAVYPWDSPEKDLAEARRLIKKHGYDRRLGELEDAEGAILK